MILFLNLYVHGAASRPQRLSVAMAGRWQAGVINF